MITGTGQRHHEIGHCVTVGDAIAPFAIDIHEITGDDRSMGDL